MEYFDDVVTLKENTWMIEHKSIYTVIVIVHQLS